MPVRKAPSGRWRADFKHNGQRLSRSFELKRDAQAWLHEQQVEAERGSWLDPRRAEVPLSEVHARWKASRTISGSTMATDSAIWKAYVEPTFGRVALSQITTPKIKTWLAAMTRKDGSPASPATRKHALRLLRCSLAWAVEEGRLRDNPALKVPSPKQGRSPGQALDQRELSIFLAALDLRYREVARVLALTGLRFSELAALNKADVIAGQDGALTLLVRSRYVLDAQGERVRLPGTKAGATITRVVPVLAPIRATVANAAVGKTTAPLFNSPRGARLDARNFRRESDWAKAAAACGHPGLRPHDLRHTAATLWLGTTGSVKVTQAVLGHASATMTLDLYGHLLDSERDRATAAMNTALGASGAPATYAKSAATRKLATDSTIN